MLRSALLLMMRVRVACAFPRYVLIWRAMICELRPI